MHFIPVETFDDWRTRARGLLIAGVPPAEISWSANPEQLSLFDQADEIPVTPSAENQSLNVPKNFLELARPVAAHRNPARFEILYRTLWRLTRGERHLLDDATDDDVLALHQMRKAVSRDVHKMKAFVRFRKVTAPDNGDPGGGENFIAWHRPDHRIVRLAAPFFSRRFVAMNWSILTPDESVTWDQRELVYGPGVPVTEAPRDDELEDLWRTYYASIFNPARIKVAMMKSEMPVRHWPTLPEASLIDDLLRQAPTRVENMIRKTEGFDETATSYLPETIDLESLRVAAECCKACDLYKPATQMVFGEGNPNARIVLIGEQPGDREDIEGRPFVGPSGQLLNDALENAGIDRDDVYITNVVKHFKFTEKETGRGGTRRLHQKPDSREIFACRPWLEAELQSILPQTVVCLGATPAQALFGRDFRITKLRGEIRPTDWCQRTIATWHPSAILRMPDATRKTQMQAELVADLALALQ